MKNYLSSLLLLITSVTTHAQDRITGKSFATRSEIIAKNGIIASSHPLATQIGLDILKKGYTGAVQEWFATNDIFAHTYPALDPTKIFEESVQNAELTISALIEDVLKEV